MDHHRAMITRKYALEQLRQVLDENPVGALLGPRQCGKSTLAAEIAEKSTSLHWFDLERADDRAALAQPELTLKPLRGLVVID